MLNLFTATGPRAAGRPRRMVPARHGQLLGGVSARGAARAAG